MIKVEIIRTRNVIIPSFALGVLSSCSRSSVLWSAFLTQQVVVEIAELPR